MTYEALRLRRVSPHLGTEVDEIDITRPLTNRQVEELRTALGEFGVLFFRDQPFAFRALETRTLGRWGMHR